MVHDWLVTVSGYIISLPVVKAENQGRRTRGAQLFTSWLWKARETNLRAAPEEISSDPTRPHLQRLLPSLRIAVQLRKASMVVFTELVRTFMT